MAKFLLCFVLFSVFSVNAQVQDTLQYARETAYQNNFTEANRILTTYNQNNRDVYGIWLQAQVAWWMGDTNRSLDLYERAILTAPDLDDLKFDYARTLFNSGEIKLAQPLLNNFLKKEPNHSEAKILLAYIDYWNGRISKAKKTAEEVLANDPANELGHKLLGEISESTAPYVNVASSFGSDDQPLDSEAYSITAGKYFSKFFSPVLRAAAVDFTIPGKSIQSYFFEGGNKFKFGFSGPEITLMGGVFKPDSNKDTIELTGSIAIVQPLVKHLFLEGKAAKTPYQYTLASLETPLMQNIFTVGLSLNNPESIVGKVAYEQQVFPDKNTIHTSYAYLLKSIINNKLFRFDLGYSFNYSHSENNTFQAEGPSLLQPGVNFNQMSGIYDPYFSPNNQMVNAALASVKIVPVTPVEVKFRTSYGFYAKADNPVIFTTRNQGNQMASEKFYYEHSYNPLEIFGEIRANVAKGLYIGANYQYSELLFYKFNQIGFTLNYSFMGK